MKSMYYLLALPILLLSTRYTYCQKENLKDVNTQVWAVFSSSYETLDAERFESIHHDDFIRVSGNQKTISRKDGYIGGFKQRWASSKRSQAISFRFTERINNGDIGSERGIYKFTIDPGTEKERSFYGKFHVVLKKANGEWKILVDYDSDEANTINETSYNNAHAIDAYNKY